ncbi:hypothetical protein FRB94_006148 [Tulasnella sp. JGI-2019a]|nr:hypothetical protein FRB94_006148 [Tulasnella sp. JGI-2019a]KAG9016541.1 hypothetical protein FRB93_010791 [Tulasnella sp. JGI-2019a]
MVRAKHVLEVLSLPAKIKLVWSRLTSSRLAVFYLVLAATHGVTQVALQITAFTVNTDAANLLNNIITVGGLQSNNFTLYDAKTKTLESCSGHGRDLTCVTIWQAATDANTLAQDASNAYASSNSSSSSATASDVTATSSVPQSLVPTSTSSNGTITAPYATSTPTASGSTASTVNAIASSSTTPAAATTQTTAKVLVTHTVFVTVAAPTTTAPEPTASLDLDRRSVSSQPPQAWLEVRLTDTNSSAPVSDTTLSVQTSGLANNPGVVDVSLECVAVLRWPLQTLRNTQREDVVFVFFQIWVLGMSVVAVLNESIPHTVAALLTHGLATMWAGFQLFDTSNFKKSFATLVVNGACKGITIFPTYWKLRGVVEILILVMNAVVLVANAFLSWKVLKVFGWATFRRIGANRKVSNVYKVVLVMATLLQLALFFMLTSVALWIDQLHSGAIGRFSSHATVEITVLSIIVCLLVPWLGLGWFSVRKESKKMLYGFFAISGIFVGEWASEFISSSWRMTFKTWAFFAIMSVVSMGLTIFVTVLGVCCLRNFGHGLPACLYGQETLEHDDFERISPPTPTDLEKSYLVDLLEEDIAWPEDTVDWRGRTPADQAVAVPLPAVVRSAHFPTIPASQPPMSERANDFQPPTTTDLRYKLSLRTTGNGTGSEAESRDWFQDTQSSRSRWSQDEADTRKSKLMVIKRWAIQ